MQKSILLDTRIKGKTFKVKISSSDDFKTFDNYQLFDDHMDLICNRDELEAAIKKKNSNNIEEDVAVYLQIKHGFKEGPEPNQWQEPKEGYIIQITGIGLKQVHLRIWYPYPEVSFILNSHSNHIFANLDAVIKALKGIKKSGKSLNEYIKGNIPWKNFTIEDKVDMALLAAQQLLLMVQENSQKLNAEKIIEQTAYIISLLQRPEDKTIISMMEEK